MEFHSSHVNTHQYEKFCLSCSNFHEPHMRSTTLRADDLLYRISPQSDNTQKSKDKNLIMPSLKCLTAHIFKKVAITEHCFVGNFLYQICFQIG